MSDSGDKPAPLIEAPAGPGRTSRLLTRICVVGVVGLLTVAAIALAIPWGWYRYKHVVLGEATVKGIVTKIGARIEGRINSIEVEPGQHVSKGQVLLRLEDRHLQAALERARAELQSTIKELDSEKLSVDQARRRLALEIERVNGVRKQATGALEAEKGNLVRLEKQYDRVAELTRTTVAAISELDQTTGERDKSRGMVKAASGVLESAEFSYQQARNDLDGVSVLEARLKVLESQIAVARARVAAAEADLDATVIRAPEDGRVLARIVELGGSARVGEPMISLWLGRAWVEAWVDERDLRKFRIGSPAEISLDTFPRHKLSGRVEAIGLESDKQLQPAVVPPTLHSYLRLSAMIPVRVTVEEDNSRIQLGLSAVVGIMKESEPAEVERPAVAQPSPLRKSSNHLTRE